MYKKHSSFSFKALLFVPRLSEHERPGAIEMLKVWVRVSGLAKIAIRQLYSISEIVTRLLGQLKVDTGLANYEWRPTLRWQLTSVISTIFTSTISVLAGYQHCQTNSRAPRVFCFRFLIKDILLKSL